LIINFHIYWEEMYIFTVFKYTYVLYLNDGHVEHGFKHDGHVEHAETIVFFLSKMQICDVMVHCLSFVLKILR